MLTIGAGGFILAGRSGWPLAFAGSAVLMLLVVPFTLTAPKLPPIQHQITSLRQAVAGPAREFLHRTGRGRAVMLLALVLLYRWPDGLLNVMAVPFLILAIALAAFLGPSLGNAMIAIGVTATPIFVRLSRGQVLAARAEDYVEAARAVGNPPARILLRHVLPNILPPVMVQATLAVAAAIIAEASLSFLGLGQQPPQPSWGSMLNTAQRFLTQAPWMAVFPGIAIFLTVLAFNLFGDGLRDVLDPKR
jgi:ABC-type microcin C transport system permease subunit YejE